MLYARQKVKFNTGDDFENHQKQLDNINFTMFVN